jgi:plasmid stabilization system protein ParE
MKVVYRFAASLEAQEAADWYRLNAGLHHAVGFEQEVAAKLRLLQEHPHMGTPGIRGMRRMPLKTYPYTLHYKVDGDTLRIFAVAHQKRRPGYWAKR